MTATSLVAFTRNDPISRFSSYPYQIDMNDVFPTMFIMSIKYAENTLFPRKYPYISYRENNDQNRSGFQPFLSIVINNNVLRHYVWILVDFL